MKTKREVLKQYAQGEGCTGINCRECPFCKPPKSCNMAERLMCIGAMAILRMFPEKKKPLLSIGTRIRFDDGSIARIESTTEGPKLSISTINGHISRSLSYLLGRAWEVVE